MNPAILLRSRETAAELKLPDKLVFRGDVKRRQVSKFGLTQEKRTQVIAYIEEGKLWTGVFVLDDEKDDVLMVFRNAAHLISYGVDMADPIGAFRLFSILDALECVDDLHSQVAMLMPIASKFGDPAEKLLGEHKDLMTNALGAQRLESILTSVPPNLVSLLRSLRQQGIVLMTDSVTDEVESGHIEFSEDLESFGIEHPRKRHERRERREAFLKPLTPHLALYLKTDEGDSPELLGVLERAALLAGMKKLATEEHLLVGLAIIGAMLNLYKTESSFVQSLMDSHIHETGFRDYENLMLQAAAQFVSRNFHGVGSQTEIAHKLLDLWRKWDSIPADETLL